MEKAEAKLDGIIRQGPKRGAAWLHAEEANDLKALVGRIAEAGADYRKATEALPPELRDMLPKIAIRNMVAPKRSSRDGCPPISWKYPKSPSSRCLPVRETGRATSGSRLINPGNEQLWLGPGPADPEKWLKINPTTKAAIRWSSIGLGIAVPSPVVISKLLEESNDEQKGPSIADLTWNGLEAVAQHIVKPFYRFGYAPTPTGAGPAVWSPGTGQFAGTPDAGTNETLQPGYGFDFSWRSFDDPIFRQDGSFGHSQARVA